MDFSEWLHQQLEQRGWSQADLIKTARSRGYMITSAHLSRILNREQGPGVEVAIAIAHGLQLPREEVFRAIGWLRSESEGVSTGEDIDPRIEHLSKTIHSLPVEIRNEVLNSVLAMLNSIRLSALPYLTQPAAPATTNELDTPPDNKEWITVAEAVALTGYAKSTIHWLLAEKKIEGWKPGHDWFTTRESILEYQRQTKRGRRKKEEGG